MFIKSLLDKSVWWRSFLNNEPRPNEHFISFLVINYWSQSDWRWASYILLSIQSQRSSTCYCVLVRFCQDTERLHRFGIFSVKPKVFLNLLLIVAFVKQEWLVQVVVGPRMWRSNDVTRPWRKRRSHSVSSTGYSVIRRISMLYGFLLARRCS